MGIFPTLLEKLCRWLQLLGVFFRNNDLFSRFDVLSGDWCSVDVFAILAERIGSGNCLHLLQHRVLVETVLCVIQLQDVCFAEATLKS